MADKRAGVTGEELQAETVFAVEDLLNEEPSTFRKFQSTHCGKDFYESVYRSIISGGGATKEQNFTHMHRNLEELMRRITSSADKKADVSLHDQHLQELPFSADSQQCIWTREDLALFRKVYDNLKIKAVNLYLIASAAKAKLRELEVQKKKMKEEVSRLENLTLKLKKDVVTSEAICVEMQKDVDFFNVKCRKLENENKICRQTISRISHKLKGEKELHYRRLGRLNSAFTSALQKVESERALSEEQGMMKQESLEEEIRDLVTQKTELVKKIREETENHSKTKKLLLHLQQHFLTVNLQNQKKSSFVQERDFIDTIDI